MSHNQSRDQSRVGNSDGHLRKSGRPGSGHQRGFYGGGGSGGGGSSVNQPSLSASWSFKKSGNGQGGQPWVNPADVNSEANATSATGRAVQNGARGQPSFPGSSNTLPPAAAKPVDMATPKTSIDPTKAPRTQAPAGTSGSAAPSTPSKGDGGATFSLQFGSISPGIMNGMQIPARTTSAPPNLDQQNQNQVHKVALKAVPSTLPIPSGSKEQQQALRKNVGRANQCATEESHTSVQLKRDFQPQISNAVAAPIPKPATLPVSGMSTVMPYAQPQVSMQFGGHGPQPIPISLPIRNSPQVPQQMFVHNLQSHPLQPQVMIHQGQGLGFPPQISHQLPPQLGNHGIGNSNPHFAQHRPVQFAGSRKTTVTITHPETHEELRLNKRTVAYTDGASSGQRSLPNATSQSQPIPSFTPSPYFPQLQPKPYFFSTSTPIPTGSQAPRFSYPIRQSGQDITIINPSVPSSMPGGKMVPSLHCGSSEARNTEPPVSAASAAVYRSIKPNVIPCDPKVGGPSVTITMPVNMSEAPKMVTPPIEAILSHQPRESEVSAVSSLQQPETITELQGTATMPMFSQHSATAAYDISAQGAQLGTSLAPDGVSGGIVAGRKKEPLRRLDSLKDRQKSSKKDLRPIHQKQMANVSASEGGRKSYSMEISKNGSSEDIKSGPFAENLDNDQDSSGIAVSTTAVNLLSHGDQCISVEAGTGEVIEGKAVSARSGSFGVSLEKEELPELSLICSDHAELPTDCGITIKEEVPLETSTTSRFEMDGSIANVMGFTVRKADHPSLGFEPSNGMLEEIGQGKSEVVDTTILECSTAKIHPVPTIAESNGSLMTPVSVKEKDNGGNTVENQIVYNRQESEKQQQHALGAEKIGEAKDKTIAFLECNKFETVPFSDSPDVNNIKDRPSSPNDTINRSETICSSDVGSSAPGASYPCTLETANKIDGDDPAHATYEEGQKIKNELDDWEYAAEGASPKLDNGKLAKGVNKYHVSDENEATCTKKYTRNFLLTFSGQCIDLPLGFEIGSDIANALMNAPISSSRVTDRDHNHSPGGIKDRSPGGSRVDRSMLGNMDDDKWIKGSGSFVLCDPRGDVGHVASPNFRPGQAVNHGALRNLRGQPPNQLVGGILSSPMQSLAPQGARNSAIADRWRSGNSRGLMLPHQSLLQGIHKAEKKYEIGQVSDKEEAKQRQLKAVLNKLTPQKFEKLFEQVKEVNIDNTITLAGVISQIFDKALMEPTFCEMYANFCFHLSSELPDFSENDEKITFRRLLLNKCQEEFERGEREQAEAERIEEEGDVKQSEQEREEKRTKARRRMLGNIRLIGELYKKRMLTERIMHECIQKLLGQYQVPDEEDIEALCKLMSTIGEIIDHPKAKVHLDAYFDGMQKLSTNHKLSSRHRFMLRDLIDLRKNKWQQRRKIEGPKKIEEVHRDAAQERQSQVRSARGPAINSATRRGLPVDYGPRGSTVLPSPNSQFGGMRGPSQVRGYGNQGVRLEERHPLENRILSVPLSQRVTDDNSITLGPQGGLARGMSSKRPPLISNIPLAEAPSSTGDHHRIAFGPDGSSYASDRRYCNSRDSKIANQFDSFSTSAVPGGQTLGSLTQNSSIVSDARPLSEEVLKDKSISTIKEFYSARDEQEVALCIKELNSPSFYPSMVSHWVIESFERKDMERDLLATLLVNLCKSHNSLLNQVQLTQGFESVLSELEEAVTDAPRAAEFLGRLFAKVTLENVVPLRDIGRLIHEGGEKPGHLLEIGYAVVVLRSILETIRAEKGDPFVQEICRSSNLQLEDFVPPDQRSFRG